MSIGAKLIKYRKEVKLTQQEVAELLNVKTNTYGSWESDKTEPSGHYFPKMAQIFGVTVDKLFPELKQIQIAPNQTNNDNAKPINAYYVSFDEAESIVIKTQEETIATQKTLIEQQQETIATLKILIGSLQEQLEVLKNKS
jgi:transcriptional regulator with XRE-family HTH domain